MQIKKLWYSLNCEDFWKRLDLQLTNTTDEYKYHHVGLVVLKNKTKIYNKRHNKA